MQKNVKDKSMARSGSVTNKDIQFFYPNPGVTIMAKDKEEADKKFHAMQEQKEDI